MHVRLMIVALLAALLPTAVSAQTPAARTYVYVQDWTIPFDKWAAFNAYMMSSVRPLLDRHIASGTITDYVIWSVPFHTDTGDTHGLSWTATSIAGTQRVLEEFLRLPFDDSRAGATYHTHLFKTLTGGGRPALPPQGGYLSVTTFRVKPGMGDRWLELWQEHVEPIYQQLLSTGAITRYDIQAEQIHVEDRGTRSVVSMSPTLEGLDAIQAAMAAATARRTPEQRRVVAEAFAAVLETGAHRETFTQVRAHAVK